MPLVKRRFYVSCREDECLKLYELLKDRIPSVNYVSMELTSRGLFVEVYGYESDIKDLWAEIKGLTGSLKEITRKSGLKRYEVSLLTKIIRKTFPPRILAEVLKRMSYRVEYSGSEDAIVTDAPGEEVTRLAEKIAELNTDAGKHAANTSTRYFIVAGCVLSGLTVEEVIRISAHLGLIEQLEGGKNMLTVDWRTALDEFLKNVKKQAL